MKVSLIIFFIGFLTIAPSIYMGVKYFDGKVVDQPYELGLTYDQDKKFISDNGLGIDIISHSKEGDKVTLEFALTKNEGVDVADSEFYVTRPATNKDQMQIQPQVKTGGVFASVFDIKNNGHYLLVAKSTVKGKAVFLQKGFYIN